MLTLAYLGIAFSLVFYVIFGFAVRFMELSKIARNKAKLIILVTSMIIFSISAILAGILNLRLGLYVFGIIFLLLSVIIIIIVSSIFFELHQINARVRMRRFMVLFDKVDGFINEGKTQDEIMDYLTRIQKLNFREASDFLEFISDPVNHKFLADVNDEIQAAKMIQNAQNDYYR